MSVPRLRYRVLILDPSLNDNLLITDLLEESFRTDIVLDAAKTVDDAIALLSLSKIDVIFVDIEQINGSGWDARKRIVELGYVVPMVLMVGYADSDFQDRLAEEGFADYITKGTFTTETLERAILYAAGPVNKNSDPMDVVSQRLMSVNAELSTLKLSIEHWKKTSSGHHQETKQEVQGVLQTLAGKVSQLEALVASSTDAVLTEMRQTRDQLSTEGKSSKEALSTEIGKSTWKKVADFVLANPLPVALAVLVTLAVIFGLVGLSQVVNLSVLKTLLGK